MTPLSTTPDKINDLYPDLTPEKLIAVYAAGPARLRHALVGLGETELLARPIEGKWSIQEIAIHLADAEIMGAARFRQALTGSDRTFSFYHQEIWCNQFDYQHAGQAALDLAVDLFAALRATTTILLKQTSPERMTCTGYHPEHGNMSVRQLIESYADHSESHLHQILDRRTRLGKPVEMEQLLPAR